MRNRLTIILFFFLCVTLSLIARTELHAQQKPNVIFFLVDDLGQRDVGCYGSEFYETPAIDQLAKEGMLFENAYSTCRVCSPSRASILTGKYPARTNLTEWLGGRPEKNYEILHHGEKLTALPDEEQTLAETLHQHGYATANYGKAHLVKDRKASELAWKVTATEIKENGYNLDIKNPHSADTGPGDPDVLLAELASLRAASRQTLDQLKSELAAALDRP